MSEIITFAVIAALLVISPGPNSVLIIKTTSAHGRLPSFANIAGLTTATFFHGIFSIFGISALLLQSAELFTLVKMAGAAYLFYIGVKAILQSFKRQPSIADSLKMTDSNTSSASKAYTSFCLEGFITQLLNPKVSMFYLAAFPQFANPGNFSVANSFVLVAIHAFIILVWFAAMTLTIERMKRNAKHSAVGQWVQRLSGSVMIYFSSLIVTQKS